MIELADHVDDLPPASPSRHGFASDDLSSTSAAGRFHETRFRVVLTSVAHDVDPSGVG